MCCISRAVPSQCCAHIAVMAHGSCRFVSIMLLFNVSLHYMTSICRLMFYTFLLAAVLWPLRGELTALPYASVTTNQCDQFLLNGVCDEHIAYAVSWLCLHVCMLLDVGRACVISSPNCIPMCERCMPLTHVFFRMWLGAGGACLSSPTMVTRWL